MLRRQIPILYSRKDKCCGCTACYASCSQQAIVMVKDIERFEYIQIGIKTSTMYTFF